MLIIYFAKIKNAKSYSEGFARCVLAKNLNVDGKNLLICKNEFGKPFLKDYPNVHFNLSHTKGAIVCAVSDKPVGVDIERIGRFNKRIAERFFTKNEQGYIFSYNINQADRFAEIWTMKEAYVKWIGKGMEIPFESFDVLQMTVPILKVIKKQGYAISVCTSCIDNSINQIQIKDIIWAGGRRCV
jgi:4'-phosphopantetheinyl transferase